MARVLFITGTGTGIGKTWLTAILTRYLLDQGLRVLALKPLASGDRSDARLLHLAQYGKIPLNTINPWAFKAPLSPVIAALQEGRTIQRTDVTQHIRAMAQDVDFLLVEGAGGLFSPLFETGDSIDLLKELCAQPIVLAPNQLGALHHIDALWRAASLDTLPGSALVLRQPPRPTLVSRTNFTWLQARYPNRRILTWPHQSDPSAILRSSAPFADNLQNACREITRVLVGSR